MGRSETTFGALAAHDDLHAGHRLPWLSNRGHLHLQAIGAPTELVDLLREIYLKLGGKESALAAKRGGGDPTPDFIWGKDQLVELDEIQHFTTDRRLTLEMYPARVSLGFNVNDYTMLCDTWRKTADRYRASKQAADFPHPGGRRAQRAYFDALRDLAAPTFGHGAVIRIPTPECDAHLAYERFTERHLR